MINKPGVPYWRLSGFYFLFFVTVGVLLPYWSLYLKSIGFNAKQIGILSAIFVFSKVFVTYFWGWIIDHTGKRMLVIKVACLFSAISFSTAIYIQSFYGLAVILFVFSLFWSAALPQVEAATLGYLGKSTHSYTVIRVWGSIGFILAVWLLGFAFEYIPIDYVPHIIFICVVSVWFSSLLFTEQKIEIPHDPQQDIKTIFFTPRVIALFSVCFLMLVSHGPYYTFYSIYLEENGYSSAYIGQLWALGVIAEVILFLGMRHLFKYFSLKAMLLTSFILAFIRWMLIGFYVEYLFILLIAQLLHAATFGIYHAVAIQYIHKIFIGRLQGRGQALYSSISFGAGMAVGSLLSGLVWDSFGPVISFNAAAIIALIAFFITWYWIKD